MKRNMGGVDRTLRFIIGVVLIIAGIFAVKSTVWTVVMIVIGAVMLLTAISGLCPAYNPMGIDTSKKKE